MSRGVSRSCEVFISEGELRISVTEQKSHVAFGAVCATACPAPSRLSQCTSQTDTPRQPASQRKHTGLGDEEEVMGPCAI